MLKKRLITAIVLATTIIAMIILLPPTFFSLLLAGISGLAAWEWSEFASLHSRLAKILYLLVLASCIGLCFFALRMANDHWSHIIFVANLCWWLVALGLIIAYQHGKSLLPSNRFVKAGIGLVILIPAWLSMSKIHTQEPQQLLFLLFLIWLADSVAYFYGKRFGKRKLATQVSPGKSWEGVYAALLLSLPFGFLYAHWLDKATVQIGILLVLATVILSIIGDLTESMFKRSVNLKDSGQLLPGHGGILDRIDSLTAAAPLFATGLWLSEGT